MKLQIGLNIAPIEGYTTLDPTKGGGSISDLGVVCEDNECTEILAERALDAIHGSAIVSTLRHWAGKLRHGGKLIVGGNDIYEICKGVTTGQLSITDLNRLLNGEVPTLANVKWGHYTPEDIKGILTEIGLRITKCRVNNRKFVVEAVRD